MLRDEASSEVVKLFGVELSTESVVGEMVRVYAQTYTKEEVQAQIAFYSSPVGRKVVATGQSLIGQVNGVVTVRANSLGPRIGVLLDEVRARAQELKTTQVPVSK